ncbi:MAG: polyprenyl synthetase family protein [Nanoarchaeota archaeon]
MKQNNGKLYFKTIHEISPEVNSYIENRVKELNFLKRLEGVLISLPEKRKQNPIMRSCLSYIFYRNLGGTKEIKDLIPALAISELSNYYCYMDNWIFDNKNNCHSNKNNLNLIIASSAIFREITQQTIDDLTSTNQIKLKISKKLSEATIRGYHGQVLDFTTTIQDGLRFDEKEFIDFYKKRADLLSGALYGLSSEIGAIIAEAEDRNILNSRKFGELFGAGMQISNDLGDFALFSNENCNTFKSYQDQLSDIVEDRITLPIYFALKNGSNFERNSLINLIGKRNASLNEKRQASKAILSSGAYDKTKTILKEYRNELKKIINQFPENEYRDAISSMISTICYNKFLRNLKSLGD